MAKLKNVTMAELKALEDKAFDVSQEAADLHHRGTSGYADKIESPLALASAFAGMSRTLADLSAWCLSKAALQEKEREIERMMTERANKDGG